MSNHSASSSSPSSMEPTLSYDRLREFCLNEGIHWDPNLPLEAQYARVAEYVVLGKNINASSVTMNILHQAPPYAPNIMDNTLPPFHSLNSNYVNNSVPPIATLLTSTPTTDGIITLTSTNPSQTVCHTTPSSFLFSRPSSSTQSFTFTSTLPIVSSRITPTSFPVSESGPTHSSSFIPEDLARVTIREPFELVKANISASYYNDVSSNMPIHAVGQPSQCQPVAHNFLNSYSVRANSLRDEPRANVYVNHDPIFSQPQFVPVSTVSAQPSPVSIDGPSTSNPFHNDNNIPVSRSYSHDISKPQNFFTYNKPTGYEQFSAHPNFIADSSPKQMSQQVDTLVDIPQEFGAQVSRKGSEMDFHKNKLFESLIQSLPRINGANPHDIIVFLNSLQYISDLNLVSDQAILLRTLPYTRDYFRVIWSDAIRATLPFSEVVTCVKEQFLPARSSRRMLSEKVYRLQRPTEHFHSFITDIFDNAHLLDHTLSEYDIVQIVLQNINPDTRSRIAFRSAPSSLQELYMLASEIQDILQLELDYRSQFGVPDQSYSTRPHKAQFYKFQNDKSPRPSRQTSRRIDRAPVESFSRKHTNFNNPGQTFYTSLSHSRRTTPPSQNGKRPQPSPLMQKPVSRPSLNFR